MFLINAKIINDDFQLVEADLKIEENRIADIGEKLSYQETDMVIDCKGYILAPGFVDIHIHGCAGADTCDGTREAIETMAEFLLSKGITSFCPTTMTLDKESVKKSVEAVRTCMENPCKGAAIVGINMEGPFIAEGRKGAHKAEYIIKPSLEWFEEIQKASGNAIKLVSVAPEQDEEGFIEKVKDSCVVSIAHTVTNFDGAKASFDRGVCHATHLFNAMPGLSHREPGVVGAILDDERVTGELICDGYHVHPAVLKMAFKVLGDRAIIISDSMRANGLEEGEISDLGGQVVTVSGGRATLEDGTLAGSVSNLHEEVKNLVSYGVPLTQAVKSASYLPAKRIGLEKEIGSIAVGKKADIVVLDEELNIAAVYHE